MLGSRVWRMVLTAVVVAVLAGVTLIMTLPGSWIMLSAQGRVFAPENAPVAPTAIVFGAAVSGDEPGTYLKPRLDTTLELFHQGSVETLIVSTVAVPYRDEIIVMRNYLQERGVPPERITDDPAGFDTNDTCRRASTVYGVEQALLVTQDFHTLRAVALCRNWQIDAFGVVAGCDECSQHSLVRNYLREAFLSRPAALLSVAA